MGWLRSSRLHSPKCRSPKFRSSNTRSPKCRSPKLHSPKCRSPKFRSPKFRSPKLGSSQIRSPKCRSSSFPPIVIVLSSIGSGGLVSGKSGKHGGGKHGGGRSREGVVHTHTGREWRGGASGEVALKEREWEWWRRRERVAAGGGGGCTHKQITKMATWTHDFGDICERACIQNPNFKNPLPQGRFPNIRDSVHLGIAVGPFDNDSPTPKRQWAPRWNALLVFLFAHPPIPPICRTPLFSHIPPFIPVFQGVFDCGYSSLPLSLPSCAPYEQTFPDQKANVALLVFLFAHPPISPICCTPLFPYLTFYSCVSRRTLLCSASARSSAPSCAS